MRIVFALFLFLTVLPVHAQSKLDSLFMNLNDTNINLDESFKELEVIIIRNYLFLKPDSAIILFDSIAAVATIRDQMEILSLTYAMRSFIYFIKANYPQSLRSVKKGLAIAEKLESGQLLQTNYNMIGLICKTTGELDKAEHYYKVALKSADDIGISTITMSNLSHVYALQEKYEEAKIQGENALKIAQQRSDNRGCFLAYSTLGEMYRMQGSYEEALINFKTGLVYGESVRDLYPLVITLLGMANVYHKQGRNTDAILWAEKALVVALNSKMPDWQKKSYDIIFRAHKALNHTQQAFDYLQKKMFIDEQIQNAQTVRSLGEMEFQKLMFSDSLKKEEERLFTEIAHQEEVRNNQQVRNLAIGGGTFAFLLAFGFYRRWIFVQKSKVIIERERDRSDNLLLNILPKDIAVELKEKGKAEARDFDMVSILFTDFKSFTETSANLSAQELVREINTCFEAFDGIMGKYNIEKIKTIGDAYMAAGGLPVPSDQSILNTVLAAIEMQDFISKRKTEMDKKSLPAFEMRVGIHTGHVVAGIVGVKKFQYDIWGDSVNTASRIESNGEVGKVNISQATYDLLKEDSIFNFESRGKIEAKGKGEIEMYFVSMA